MQIECILLREGGTLAEIGGTEYHFIPNTAGAHVAEVEDKAHIQRFLSIGEAYRIYDAEPAKGKKGTKGKGVEPEAVALGSSKHPMSFEIGEATYSQEQIVAMALEKSGLSVEDWNAQAEDDRLARIDMALDDLAEAAEKDAK
jgi:hypothetical protein